MYRLTGNGLQTTKRVELQEGYVYYMGASSSPSAIIVTKVEKDKVWFVRRYDAEWKGKAQPRFEQRFILEDLVASAGETLRKQYEQAMQQTGPFAKFAQIGTKYQLDEHGSEYAFEKRYVCMCCGDDFESPVDGLSSCCEQDYKENYPAI